MTETQIKAIIDNTLGITEYKLGRNLATLPSYHLDYDYLHVPSEFENGKCTISEVYVQIDLYYSNKNDFTRDKNLLIQALYENSIYPNVESYFDATNKYYRATFNFTVAEREV